MNVSGQRIKRQRKSRFNKVVADSSRKQPLLSSKERRMKRDELSVRREARAVLGMQSQWLDTPNGMYGGGKPIDVVRRGHKGIVLNVLNSIKYGMFS